MISLQFSLQFTELQELVILKYYISVMPLIRFMNGKKIGLQLDHQLLLINER